MSNYQNGNFKTPCLFDGCVKSARSARLGLCSGHHRQRWLGKPLVPLRNWSREPYLDVRGYLVVSATGHPNADKRGRILQHRLVMTEMLGRSLQPGENVHHINGVKDDNRPENLELWLIPQPAGQRASDLERTST